MTKEGVVGRVVLTWCVAAAALFSVFLWLQPDLKSTNGAVVFWKLLLITLIGGTAVSSLFWGLLKQYQNSSRRLASFVAALPATEGSLAEEDFRGSGPLVRELPLMAERIRLITERAKLELSRREVILACMTEGVLAVDEDLRVIFCNNAFAKAFNTRVLAAEGKALYEVVREPIIRETLATVLKTGQPKTDRFQLPSAAGRWFEANAHPFRELPRSGAVIVLHDVTDIERQEQARKDFVADVSHEFRTPLAAIRGYAETLLDGALEDEENNRKFVEIIQSHAIRLNNIASDLLVISELDANVRPAVPPERISMVAVIQAAAHTVEAHAATRGVRLVTSNCEDCAVVGYRFRLEQALTNLMDNAVKFNKPSGEVVVECGPALDGQVKVSVADNGIGIPSEDLNRIFQRFYRVDKARARSTGGTGLGLPIVKEVVERMGGTVTVESQLGRGTRFTILLEAA
jgi:two-component system, OmpR family, phosphate regulon sensor histidine kinase PhoR